MGFSVTIGSAARSALRCVRPASVAVATSALHAGLVSTSTRAPTHVLPAVATASTLTMVCFTAGQTGSTMHTLLDNEYTHDRTPFRQEFVFKLGFLSLFLGPWSFYKFNLTSIVFSPLHLFFL